MLREDARTKMREGKKQLPIILEEAQLPTDPDDIIGKLFYFYFEDTYPSDTSVKEVRLCRLIVLRVKAVELCVSTNSLTLHVEDIHDSKSNRRIVELYKHRRSVWMYKIDGDGDSMDRVDEGILEMINPLI